MTAEIIDDAMGSVCRKTVKSSATTIAMATDKTAIAYREIADDFERHRGGLDFDIIFPRPAYARCQTNAAQEIFNRDFPDDSGNGVNIRAFPDLQQD